MSIFKETLFNNYEDVINIQTDNEMKIFSATTKDFPNQTIISTKINVNSSMKEEFRRFLVQLSNNVHPNLIQIKEVCEFKPNQFQIIYLFPSKCQFITLKDLEKRTKISNELKIYILSQITNCFCFLEKSIFPYVLINEDDVLYDTEHKKVYFFNINFQYFIGNIQTPFFETTEIHDQLNEVHKTTVKSFISVIPFFKHDIQSNFPYLDKISFDDIQIFIMNNFPYSEKKFREIEANNTSDREIELHEAKSLFLNENRTLEDIKESARIGFPPAQAFLALGLDPKYKINQEMQYLQKPADNGEVSCQYNLGTFLMTTDIDSSLHYLFLSVKNNCIEAFLNLAILIIKNPSLGDKYKFDVLGLLLEAKEKGLKESYYYLGLLYLDGFTSCSYPVTKKLDQAYQYLFKSILDLCCPKYIFVIKTILDLCDKGVSIESGVYDMLKEEYDKEVNNNKNKIREKFQKAKDQLFSENCDKNQFTKSLAVIDQIAKSDDYGIDDFKQEANEIFDYLRSIHKISK